jgi:hypothetical protein
MGLVFKPDGDPLHDRHSIVSIWLVITLVALSASWVVVLIKISYDMQKLRSQDSQHAADLASTYAEHAQRTVKEIDQIESPRKS